MIGYNLTNQFRYSNYPFEDKCSLQSRGNGVNLRGVIRDIAVYASAGDKVFLSGFHKKQDWIQFVFGVNSTSDTLTALCKQTTETVSIIDRYLRCAGRLLLGDLEQINRIKDGSYSFSNTAAVLLPHTIVPADNRRLREIITEDGVYSGNVEITTDADTELVPTADGFKVNFLTESSLEGLKSVSFEVWSEEEYAKGLDAGTASDTAVCYPNEAGAIVCASGAAPLKYEPDGNTVIWRFRDARG